MKNLKAGRGGTADHAGGRGGPSEAFVEAVRKNVEEWLQNHIMSWDKEVAGYAERNRRSVKTAYFFSFSSLRIRGSIPRRFISARIV